MAQINTCVGFVALAKADTKFSRGLCFTGVGAVSCAWGEFIMSVGNLQKGERYGLLAFLDSAEIHLGMLQWTLFLLLHSKTSMST